MFFHWSYIMWWKAWFQVLTFFFSFLSTSILYNDDVSTMAYVVDKAFGLATYIMDSILVLNMWWIGFCACVGFVHLQHAWTIKARKGSPPPPQVDILACFNPHVAFDCRITSTPDVMWHDDPWRIIKHHWSNNSSTLDFFFFFFFLLSFVLESTTKSIVS